MLNKIIILTTLICLFVNIFMKNWNQSEVFEIILIIQTFYMCQALYFQQKKNEQNEKTIDFLRYDLQISRGYIEGLCKTLDSTKNQEWKDHVSVGFKSLTDTTGHHNIFVGTDNTTFFDPIYEKDNKLI